MRIFVAGIATETNSFSPIFVGLDDFKASLYAAPYKHPETPTLCTAALVVLRQRAKKDGIDLIEGTTSWADPGGLISQQCYETLRDEILAQVTAAIKQQPLDGVVLCLHGAMIAQGYDDPEGELICQIRKLVGDKTIIGANLDPHSHLTAKRFEYADILCAFKEFPHTDFVQTGEQIVDLVIRSIKGEIKPKMAQYDCKMIDIFPSSRQPMRQFVDDMLDGERQQGVLSLSLIHGFMAGDSPWMGTKMIAIYDDNMDIAAHLAKDFGDKIISIRGQSMPSMLTEDIAVEQALLVVTKQQTPVIIADVWDNPGGGVAGDGTIILQSLLSLKPKNTNIKIAIGTIWDPMAVQLCFKAGIGAIIPLRFGAKSAPNTGQPIDKMVTVINLNAEAAQTFGASQVPMGASVVIEFEGVQVILNSTRAQAFEPSLFENMGIEPLSQDILVIKSTNHFYAGFNKISDHIIYCDAGKPYPNNPKTTAYTKAPKNIWPLVDDPWGCVDDP
ncbi:MAG: M81 family metallopeptidase [Rhizobiales bacterium]|nr:M81 family metallopeptidase [Hyphomicrobiales bacterium]NRB13126.1 M81 family metallopeptidase [Hyphomicrobiales bacterium]